MVFSVHGDDFTISGPERSPEWLRDFLKTRWDVKATILGPESHQAQKVRVLNRSIRWTARGVEYEADPRHRLVILKELGLEGCKSVTTPYGPQEQGLLQDQGELLVCTEASKFRAIVARLNYLAADRPDTQYATKEVSKRMATPREPDWQALRRIGRYLAGAPRAVQILEWQSTPVGLSAYVDSDWAGDKKTCKSTSGGMIFRGMHLLKSWSTNQQIVALSSGEAELYASVKGAAQTLGMISMGVDFGEELTGTVYSDSSAALGILTRSGLGKVRHIRVQYLWLQEKVASNDLSVRKVAGETNPADLLTKGLAQELLRRHVSFAGMEVRPEPQDEGPLGQAVLGTLRRGRKTRGAVCSLALRSGRRSCQATERGASLFSLEGVFCFERCTGVRVRGVLAGESHGAGPRTAIHTEYIGGRGGKRDQQGMAGSVGSGVSMGSKKSMKQEAAPTDDDQPLTPIDRQNPVRQILAVSFPNPNHPKKSVENMNLFDARQIRRPGDCGKSLAGRADFASEAQA